jgi:type VI secretion system secreted protein VgrG
VGSTTEHSGALRHAAHQSAFPSLHEVYILDVPRAASAKDISVVRFTGIEAIGEARRFAITLTHPLADLPRSDYLNRPASFTIQPPTPPGLPAPIGAGRKIQGVITAFNQLASNRDQTTYEVVLESRLALLRNTPTCRFFLNQSFPQIIAQILREHGFDAIQARFDFRLYRQYEPREFVMQWHESDLAFITRLCRRSGIWFVQEEGEHCEVVRFGDDLTHYRRKPGLTVPFHAHAGLTNTGTESIQSIETHTRAIPERQLVRAYNYRAAPLAIDAENIIRGDDTTYGQAYTWAAQHLTDADARWEAQLRREAALAEQVVYRGAGNVVDLMPSNVLKLADKVLPEAEHGVLVTRVESSGSRSDAYRHTFTAIPSDRFYRLPLNEESWPKVHGTISGRITSPNRYKFAYVDAAGEYIVDLHLDRDTRPAGGNSCRLRLAKPFAGSNQTGFHFPLIDGTEVLIGFHDGNPDFPFIAHVMHNARATDPVVSDERWLSRNVLRTQSNNTLQMEDWDNEQHIKVATERGKSQLTLGHSVDRGRKKRGDGFELRTDMKGSVRAGQGLLLSADAQPFANGPHLDMKAALGQLQVALAQAQGLAQAASVAKAEIADLKAENEWLKNSLNELKEAVMLLSSPKGIALATPDRVSVAAGKDVNIATSAGFNLNAQCNATVAAAGALSLFAHNGGAKLFAARGKVLMQAQSDAMELVAQKDMQLTSASSTLTLNAANGVVISGGGTAYIKVQGDNVEIGGAGCLVLKIIEIQKQGPGALKLPLPKFEQSAVKNSEKFVLCDDITGRPVADRSYRIELANGKVVEGRTSQDGETSLSVSDVAQGMKLLLSKIKGV